MKKAIAMRCTQEQFDAIKPKLKGLKIELNVSSGLEYFPYLTNPYKGIAVEVCNYKTPNLLREFFEIWDEKVFLDACGIEVKPTLDKYKVDTKKIADMPYKTIWDHHPLRFGIDWGNMDSHNDILSPNIDIKISDNLKNHLKNGDIKVGYEKSNYHSDIIEAMQHDMSVPIPDYKKVAICDSKRELITDDNEYYKVISGGSGALGANNEIGKIVEVNEKEMPKNWRGAYWDDEKQKHNALLVIKTISGDYWGLCQGFKIEKATNDQIMKAKTDYARKLLDKKLTEQSVTFANNSSINAFRKAFDAIDTDPKNEVNRLKLRVKELEAENATILSGGKSKYESEIDELKTENKALKEIISDNIEIILSKYFSTLFKKH